MAFSGSYSPGDKNDRGGPGQGSDARPKTAAPLGMTVGGVLAVLAGLGLYVGGGNGDGGASDPWLAVVLAIVGAILAVFGVVLIQRRRKQGRDGDSAQPPEQAEPELRRQDESEEI